MNEVYWMVITLAVALSAAMGFIAVLAHVILQQLARVDRLECAIRILAAERQHNALKGE